LPIGEAFPDQPQRELDKLSGRLLGGVRVSAKDRGEDLLVLCVGLFDVLPVDVLPVDVLPVDVLPVDVLPVDVLDRLVAEGVEAAAVGQPLGVRVVRRLRNGLPERSRHTIATPRSPAAARPPCN
jgi:hypothetical protein